MAEEIRKDGVSIEKRRARENNEEPRLDGVSLDKRKSKGQKGTAVHICVAGADPFFDELGGLIENPFPQYSEEEIQKILQAARENSIDAREYYKKYLAHSE